jgi:glutathione S-transferase
MFITPYTHRLSPFAQKVKIALREKSVPFDQRNGFTGGSDLIDCMG